MLAAADMAERRKAEYTADVLWLLTRAVHVFMGARDFSVDAPSRYARVIDGRTKPADTRTERQIADDVIARLEALEL